MLDVECGHCGAQMSLGAEWAGKKGKCPSCGSVVNIPTAAPPPVPPAPRAPQPLPVSAAAAASPQAAKAARSPLPAVAAIPSSVSLPAVPLDGRGPRSSPPGVRPAAVTPQVTQPASWPTTWWLALASIAGLLLVVAAVIALSSRPGKEPDEQLLAGASGAEPSRQETAPSTLPVKPPRDEKHPAVQPQLPVDPAAVNSTASRTTQRGADTESPAVPPRQPVGIVESQPKAPAARPPNRQGGLSGGSREYDDLHCQRLQSQHAVRVPAAATMLEVDGERLPIANLALLSEGHAPLLFLPRGQHVVRFRPGEQAVLVKVDSDLSTVYQDMRRFFGIGATVREKELLSRSARTMDVHGAPFLLNLMGSVHLGKDGWEAAERKFRRSLRVNPLFSPAHLNLAVCLDRRQATGEAKRELDLAEATNVGNVFGLAGAIAELRRKFGQPVGQPPAEEVQLVSYVHSESLTEEDRRLTALLKGMSKYAVREEDRGKILNNLAVHFADTGRTELALDHFRGALAVVRTAGPERFALARQVLTHMSDACRKAGFDEAQEYQDMRNLVSP